MSLKRVLAVALVGSSLLLATPTQAEPDARTYLQWIDRGEAMPPQYLLAILSGMEWVNSELEGQGFPKIFCTPERLALTVDQNVNILREYVAAHPPVADSPVGLALLYALRSTFPCPTNQTAAPPDSTPPGDAGMPRGLERPSER